MTVALVTKVGSDWTLLARVTAKNGSGAASPTTSEGNLVTQANVSSITVQKKDVAGNVLNSSSPTVATTIYNTLQTGGIWGNLSGGGNFEYDIPNS